MAWIRRLALLLLVASVAAVPPAHADHNVRIFHQPPPAALEGGDLRLSVTVLSTCGILPPASYCGSYNLSVYYFAPAPAGATVKRSISVHGSQVVTGLLGIPVFQTVVVIPGHDVVRNPFRYYLTVFQAGCESLFICVYGHYDTARAPAGVGTYAVPLVRAS